MKYTPYFVDLTHLSRSDDIFAAVSYHFLKSSQKT